MKKKRKKGQGTTAPQPNQPKPKKTPTASRLKTNILIGVVVGVILLLVAGFLLMRTSNPMVVIDTNRGTIKLELYQSQAPITVKNFLKYVDDKHYDGTIFHRITQSGIFVIQGGGFTPDMKPKPSRGPIKLEATKELSNVEGTIAMARTSLPDSATDQFYINVKNNTGLDHSPNRDGYAVFGKVVSGMDVVREIHSVETRQEKPLDPIVIKSIRRVE